MSLDARVEELRLRTRAGFLVARRQEDGTMHVWAETHAGRPDDLLPRERSLVETMLDALKPLEGQ